MVSLKGLLLTVAALSVSVLADDPPAPTGSVSDAQAYWAAGSDLSVAVDGDAGSSKRSSFSPRNTPLFKDPYQGLCCKADYDEPPCDSDCNRNNCFREFLDARDGSPGKHCPKEAFAFCCIWNQASVWEKYWAVESGFVYEVAPYSKNCADSTCWQTVDKIDDVCGCTLHHKVTLDINSEPDYWNLRHYGCGDAHCH